MSEGVPKDVAKTGEEPTKVIEIGGKKFEMGPNLGELTWNDMNEKVTELNQTLKEGEKPWRILTANECGEVVKLIKFIWSMEGIPDSDKRISISKTLQSLGFDRSAEYWTGTEDNGKAWSWKTGSELEINFKDSEITVQCVREV